MSGIHNEGEISYLAISCDRFEWTIRDFLNHNCSKRIESPCFPCADASWHLAISSYDTGLATSMSLTLRRTQSSDFRHKIRVGIRKKDGKDGMIVSGETDNDGFFEVRKFVTLLEISMNKTNLFPHGHLTIFCEISTERIGAETSKTTETSTDLLIKDLGDLFIEGRNSDIVMKVDGEEFKAHKAIVGARCPVFASMFQHDMTEKNSGVVDIPDCSASAFEVFLLYLYTGKVDGVTSDTVFNLYYVADKYCVQCLKEHCVKFMRENLSVDNFCGVVALSLRHNESVLLETATRFFSENAKLIVKTDQWQMYLKEYPKHANELYIKAIDA